MAARRWRRDAGWRALRLHAPPPMTARSRLVRRRDVSPPVQHFRRFAPDAALWREPAPAGGFLQDRHASRCRHGAAGAGQGAVVQQPERHRCGVRVRRRVRGSGRGDRQACQSMRGGAGRHAGRGVGAGAALRSGVGVRRHRRGEPGAGRGGGRENRGDFHGSYHRARCGCGRVGGTVTQEELAAAAGRRTARSCGAGCGVPQRVGRVSGADARCRADHGAATEGGNETGADRGGAGRPGVCVRGLQAREVERDRLCEGRRDHGDRRRANEPRRFSADRRVEKRRGGEGSGAYRCRWRRAAWLRPMRSFRLPTGWRQRWRPGRRLWCSPAGRSATRR